ncbi:MAG: FdtA/QdtA family cupin domain-containing protein [Algibacter sp.]
MTKLIETMKGIELIEIPKVSDVRGSLGVIEKGIVPFEINRVYYLYDVPHDAYRGGHAHKSLTQLLIALSGSFDVHLNNGKEKIKVNLNKPNMGLLIKSGVWREIDNFSSGSVCLVLASKAYDEDDYIRDYEDFKRFTRA